MIAETLRDRLQIDTFRPFRVRLRKGRSIVIREKFRGIAMRTQLAVAVNDRLRFIPYAEIVGVEPIRRARMRKHR